MVAQGELWLMEPPNGKRRPVLVVSRNEAIPVLNDIVVAPVTSTIRSIPTCISVGPEEGIDHDSVATFDNLAAVPKFVLTTRLGSLGPDGRDLICAALTALADC
ncbi:MAG: type II toxin-antitoxin system PemK/MazF family toxin [Ilumatobacteraceae bacterium]